MYQIAFLTLVWTGTKTFLYLTNTQASLLLCSTDLFCLQMQKNWNIYIQQQKIIKSSTTRVWINPMQKWKYLVIRLTGVCFGVFWFLFLQFLVLVFWFGLLFWFFLLFFIHACAHNSLETVLHNWIYSGNLCLSLARNSRLRSLYTSRNFYCVLLGFFSLLSARTEKNASQFSGLKLL